MSQELRKILANNVKEFRNKYNLTREQLSLLLDCDNSYVSKLEKEKVNITLDKLEKISNFFNINFIDLFER